jgi:hypothetical protein
MDVAVACADDEPRILVERNVESGVAIPRSSMVVVGSGFRLSLLAAEETTSSLAFPFLSSEPSNVTSEFSDAQLRLAVLKRARMVFPVNGMEKLDCASAISRGMESPSVTFAVPLESVVVVQPVDAATVHVAPVKPFVHIQAQDPLSRKEVPPF